MICTESGDCAAALSPSCPVSQLGYYHPPERHWQNATQVRYHSRYIRYGRTQVDTYQIVVLA